jgi:hypothetical protein
MHPPVDHQSVEIESFQDAERSGGKILLRPVRGQKFSSTLRLEGNKSLIADYPVGTRFKVQASLAHRSTGGEYLFSSWQWDVRVLSRPDGVEV